LAPASPRRLSTTNASAILKTSPADIPLDALESVAAAGGWIATAAGKPAKSIVTSLRVRNVIVGRR
jgi:hypothetical protein